MGSPVGLSQPSTLTTHYQCHHRVGADALYGLAASVASGRNWVRLGVLGCVLTADISEASGAGRLVRSLFSYILLLTAPGHDGARAVSTSMAACMRTRGRCRFARATLREAGQRAVVAAMIWMVRRAGTISGFEKRRFVLSGQGRPRDLPPLFPFPKW